jgi:2-polyprenyl-3-methyl-5-hydroxy-6-metoxy-1,4-benzoquinol methylase
MTPPAGHRYYTNARSEMADLLPANYQKVLDIGCAAGAFAQTLRPGTEVWGIEPVPAMAKVAATKLHRVLQGTFDTVSQELPLAYFDLVTCNDVIEHMTDHEDFLSKIRVHMKPNAYLAGSLPNIRFYATLFELVFAGEWRYQDMGILDRTHQRFFTSRSIRRTLMAQGYIIEDMIGINPVQWHKMSWTDRLRYFALLLLTGWRSDIRFRQFAFRTRLGHP